MLNQQSQHARLSTQTAAPTFDFFDAGSATLTAQTNTSSARVAEDVTSDANPTPATLRQRFRAATSKLTEGTKQALGLSKNGDEESEDEEAKSKRNLLPWLISAFALLAVISAVGLAVVLLFPPAAVAIPAIAAFVGLAATSYGAAIATGILALPLVASFIALTATAGVAISRKVKASKTEAAYAEVDEAATEPAAVKPKTTPTNTRFKFCAYKNVGGKTSFKLFSYKSVTTEERSDTPKEETDDTSSVASSQASN